MPTFRVTGGALSLASVGSNYPSNELPGVEGPVDPGYGISSDRPAFPIVLPPPPPGIWPPPTGGNPIVPIGPDNTLPVQPGTIWPSPNPPRPDNTLPAGGGRPDNTLPGAQPGIDNTLPTGPVHPDHTLPSQTFWMLCYSPSLGWKYVSVDPSLRPGYPLPPHAEPRR